MSDRYSLTKRVASGLGWSFAERILAQLVSLLVSVVLARLLDPEHYGTISIVMVFISICDALVNGGFGNALVQKKDTQDIDFNSICWLSIGVAAVLYTVLFLSAPLVASFYEDSMLVPVIRVMGIRFLFTAFNSVQQAYVQKKMIFKKSFIATWGGAMISGALGIGMAMTGFGVWALVAQYLSNVIIGTVVLSLMIPWKPRFEVSGDSIRQMWKYGAKVLCTTLVFTLKDNIRTLVIGKRFSTEDLAQYNQGQKFPALLVTDIADSLGKVMFPVLSDNQTDRTVLKTYMRKSIQTSSYLLIPMMVGLFAVCDTFVSAVLTDKWLPCVPYMRILCVVYITRPLSTIFQKMVMSVGKSGVTLTHEIITSFMTIALLAVAVLVFNSIELIAWSYVAVMLIGIAFYVVVIHKEFDYKYWEMVTDYLPPFAISIVMGLCAYAAGFLQIHNLLKLALQIMVGIGTYVILSILFKMKSFYYLKTLLRDLVKKKC